jgi:predicted nucleic acid-binding protein
MSNFLIVIIDYTDAAELMDLKIAAIALTNNAILLTRNLSDFALLFK